MSPSLNLSGDFRQPDLDSLCDELRGVPNWPDDEPAHVELRDLQGMGPTPLAVLLASLNSLYKRQMWDPMKHVNPPSGNTHLECLHPKPLNRLLSEESGHWQESTTGSLVLGCECFTGLDGVDAVTRSLYGKLAVHTDWPTSSLKSMNGMIFELSENVLQHSGTKGGVAVLQVRPTDQRVVLAIADNGIGIRNSLARNPDFSHMKDDLAAISKAMGARTTGEPGTGGGMGLFLARCLVRSNGGAFVVRSGEACREESDALCNSKGLPPLHGTLVSVEARTDLPFEYDESVAGLLGQNEVAVTD